MRICSWKEHVAAMRQSNGWEYSANDKKKKKKKKKKIVCSESFKNTYF